MDAQLPSLADRFRYPNGVALLLMLRHTLTTQRKILIGLALLCCTGIAIWVSMALPFFLAMRERGQVEDAVFMPFADLRAEFLHNGFGVYILEFSDHSLLTDASVERLLLLNEMPEEYELTLMIETAAVTDASIATLAKLTTVDAFFVDKSGLTLEGVAALKASLPAGTISHYTRENDG